MIWCNHRFPPRLQIKTVERVTHNLQLSFLSGIISVYNILFVTTWCCSLIMDYRLSIVIRSPGQQIQLDTWHPHVKRTIDSREGCWVAQATATWSIIPHARGFCDPLVTFWLIFSLNLREMLATLSCSLPTFYVSLKDCPHHTWGGRGLFWFTSKCFLCVFVQFASQQTRIPGKPSIY